MHLGELEKKLLLRALALAQEREHTTTVLAAVSGKRRDDLSRFCTENGVGLIEIRLPPPGIRTIGEDDPHWSQETHRLIAEQLTPLFRH